MTQVASFQQFEDPRFWVVDTQLLSYMTMATLQHGCFPRGHLTTRVQQASKKSYKILRGGHQSQGPFHLLSFAWLLQVPRPRLRSQALVAGPLQLWEVQQSVPVSCHYPHCEGSKGWSKNILRHPLLLAERSLRSHLK